MPRPRRIAGFAGLALAASLAPAGAEPAGEPAWARRVERQGVLVAAEIEPLAGGPLVEGAAVAVRFRILDVHSGRPWSGLALAAWMDRLPAGAAEPADACRRKVETFLGGGLLSRPELDLNAYTVLALNEDATISVVDPLFGFGGSQLLDLVVLSAPAYDWALAERHRLLFVSLPAAGRVAAVSTDDWRVVAEIETGGRPGRLALQPDGETLWVAHRDPAAGAAEGWSGVTAVDVGTLAAVGRVATGRGDHDLAFDDRGHLFVTNRDDGTVAVVDTARRRLVRRVATAADPVSIDWSPAAGVAWVSHRASGIVAAVDAERDQPRARVAADPGLGELRFAPGGRLALVVNPETDELHVLDAAAAAIVQTADMEDGPDHVAFSDQLAFVRHRGSEAVLMVPLVEIGRPGAPVPVVDFPGGQHPPGEGGAPTPAAGIVQAPGARAVLVANPLDRAIYYYKEGMAAPMGHFQNYGRLPRAVRVVDRSLREVAPGTYETVVALRRPGAYELAVFLDAPRLVHCFDLRVAEDPARAARRAARRPLEVRHRPGPREAAAGEEVAVRFDLADPAAGAPVAGRDDVEALTFLAPGIWQERHLARPLPDGGYEVRFTPPRPGLYYVFVRAPALGLDYREAPYVTLTAAAEGAAAAR